MSTLYGSDAIAGVINIITRKSSDEKIKFHAKTAYGSFNTNELSLGANGRSGILGYSVNLSRDFTEGITEADPGQNSGFNKDGFERRAISTRISLDAFEGFTITPFLNYSDYDGDYDAGAFADGDNRYEASLLNTGARVNYETGDLELRHATTFTQTERKFTDAFGVFNPSASLLNSDLFGMYNKFESVRFLAGFNVQELNFELNGIDEGSQILSPYLTAYFESGFGLNGELGVRLNDHSEYGSNWTFNIAPVYNVNEQVKLLASVSSGFKAPTLNELFGPFGSNTNLKPQRSLTFDTGIEFNSSDMKFSGSVIYFQRKIDDLISYDSNLGYINLNEQNDSGIEVKMEYSLPLTQAEVFYNFLDGAITQNGEETDNLIRRPDHSFGLKVSQLITEELRVNLFGKYVGEREDVFFNTNNFMNESVTLDSYVLVDLDIQYKFLNDKLDLFASVNNLLNADYTEVYGFNTPGIHYKAGLRFSF
ncbi:MAG TPA: TonB-dependent receptor, partial [Gracilimonas sp.]|uniref:TonB-dependent receptor plug domain-containing protein n=1 Tax=Gracilimonas sp. TaxID=1974203 RepID=UPI002DB23767|nr:TonB-dependent receptor [Gracilimonas sp.]